MTKEKSGFINIDNALKKYSFECGRLIIRKATPEEIKRYDMILEKAREMKGNMGYSKWLSQF